MLRNTLSIQGRRREVVVKLEKEKKGEIESQDSITCYEAKLMKGEIESQDSITCYEAKLVKGEIESQDSRKPSWSRAKS